MFQWWRRGLKRVPFVEPAGGLCPSSEQQTGAPCIYYSITASKAGIISERPLHVLCHGVVRGQGAVSEVDSHRLLHYEAVFATSKPFLGRVWPHVGARGLVWPDDDAGKQGGTSTIRGTGGKDPCPQCIVCSLYRYSFVARSTPSESPKRPTSSVRHGPSQRHMLHLHKLGKKREFLGPRETFEEFLWNFTGRQCIALCAQCWHCPSCHWAANSTISSWEPLCLSHLTVKMASRHPWIYQAISCRLQDRRHLRTSNQRTWCLSTRQWSCTWIDNHSCHG